MACQSVNPVNPTVPQASDQLQKHAVLSAKLVGLLLDLDKARVPLKGLAAIPAQAPSSQHEHAVVGTLLRTKLDPRLEALDEEDEERVRRNRVGQRDGTKGEEEEEEAMLSESDGEEGEGAKSVSKEEDVQEALESIKQQISTHDATVDEAMRIVQYLQSGVDLRERLASPGEDGGQMGDGTMLPSSSTAATAAAMTTSPTQDHPMGQSPEEVDTGLNQLRRTMRILSRGSA